MKDFRHASRLYIDDNFKLAPKQKFLFHVVFDIDNTVPARAFTTNERLELNMLVKSCELPKYDMNLEEKQQYNKKVYIGTRIKYAPVTITFHDDHADTVNAFWKSYYEYNISDSLSVANAGGVNTTKDNAFELFQASTQFGMDNAQKRKQPFLKNITIFAMHKKRFTSFTLINPIIGSFSHDTLDQADGAGIMSNTMQIFYETVLYGVGLVRTGIPGFATVHYDLEPSPLSVLGRGTTSIFGPGGVVDGIGSVIGDIQNNNFGVGTILTAVNTYNNARKIKAKAAVKEELKGIVKEGIIDIGKQAGTITNPVGNFSVGNAALSAVAVGATLAGAKGLVDDRKNKNNLVISNPVIDTRNFLSPTESFNLLNNNLPARNQVAASIYYKLIGSRKGLTIAQSDVQYTASTDAIKNVYRSRALTDVAKLVTEGYIRINRVTNEVSIVAERARL